MSFRKSREGIGYMNGKRKSRLDYEYDDGDYDCGLDEDDGAEDLDKLILRFYKMKECLDWEEE